MTTYRISEVAARTGFRPSALRYYESVGLLEPVRTDAGYRLYDDRSVERLRFVARAKELGLRLDDIVELAGLWDADRCAATAARLADLVARKLIDTEDRIATLRGFAADLAAAQRDLDAVPGDASCDDGCACVTAGVNLTTKPAPDGRPPFACTLDAPSFATRREDWRRLARRAIERNEVPDGVRLRFGPDPAVAAEVARLSAAEQSCCAFLSFSLRFDHRGTDLEVGAPAEARTMLHDLVADAA